MTILNWASMFLPLYYVFTYYFNHIFTPPLLNGVLHYCPMYSVWLQLFHSERRQVSWPRNLQLHGLDEKSWYRPTNSIYAAPWYGILNRFRKFYNSPNSESEFFAEFEKRYFLVQFYFLPEQNHHIHRNRICSLEFCIRHLAQNRHTEF